MKPRFAIGTGTAPIYLAYIRHDTLQRGALVFKGGSLGERRAPIQVVPFQTELELLEKLRALLTRRLPLSIGGPSMGAAESVALLIEEGKLSGPYIEIAWSGPERWTLREMIQGAVEWQEVCDAHLFAEISFDQLPLK